MSSTHVMFRQHRRPSPMVNVEAKTVISAQRSNLQFAKKQILNQAAEWENIWTYQSEWERVAYKPEINLFIGVWSCYTPRAGLPRSSFRPGSDIFIHLLCVWHFENSSFKNYCKVSHFQNVIFLTLSLWIPCQLYHCMLNIKCYEEKPQ